MIKVIIKLEDFRHESDEPYFVTETVSETSEHISDVLNAVRRTLIGHTFGEGLVNQYINWDERSCEVIPIENNITISPKGWLFRNGVNLGTVKEFTFTKG